MPDFWLPVVPVHRLVASPSRCGIVPIALAICTSTVVALPFDATPAHICTSSAAYVPDGMRSVVRGLP